MSFLVKYALLFFVISFMTFLYLPLFCLYYELSFYFMRGHVSSSTMMQYFHDWLGMFLVSLSNFLCFKLTFAVCSIIIIISPVYNFSQIILYIYQLTIVCLQIWKLVCGSKRV